MYSRFFLGLRMTLRFQCKATLFIDTRVECAIRLILARQIVISKRGLLQNENERVLNILNFLYFLKRLFFSYEHAKHPPSAGFLSPFGEPPPSTAVKERKKKLGRLWRPMIRAPSVPLLGPVAPMVLKTSPGS